jgi:hypothetical protein
VGTVSFACGDDRGYSAPNCVMTYPPDTDQYLISAFAVKTASGQCPPIPMNNGTWNAQPQLGPFCSSFRASDGVHFLTTPWCRYVFEPSQGAVLDDNLYEQYTHQPLNAAGLCSNDVVLIEPVAGSARPHGPGCSTCTGSIVVPVPP